jgi:hypothetical protein
VSSGIGVLREGPLHAAVKDLLARPGDRAEVPLDGFVIDLVRGDGELVEIQTGSFSPLGPKLDALLDSHRIRIVHPVPAERRVVRIDEDGEVHSARRSPAKATALDVFDRLVSFPSLLGHPNLVIEVLLCREDHVRGVTPGRSRSGRRRRDPGERRLVDVLERVELRSAEDALALLPDDLPDPFTTRELADALGCGLVLAQRVVYCLRGSEAITAVGTRGRAPLYSR